MENGQIEKKKRVFSAIKPTGNPTLGNYLGTMQYWGGMADEYMLLADFESYRDAHARAGQAYLDQRRWNQMSLMNIARSGIFAADRSIRDYARDIWNVPVVE